LGGVGGGKIRVKTFSTDGGGERPREPRKKKSRLGCLDRGLAARRRKKWAFSFQSGGPGGVASLGEVGGEGRRCFRDLGTVP